MLNRYGVIVGFLVLMLLPGEGLQAGGGKAHWGYEGHDGPAHWGDLSHDYQTCKAGRQQSPVNLAGSQPAALPAIRFHYRPSPLHVVNNGHTIQVNYAPGSYIEVDGKRYELLQFHFHSPSEHQVDGKPADMVAHLVHRAADGQLGVVGVLFHKGEDNAELSRIWAHLPQHAGEQTRTMVRVNARNLLPARRTYYQYSGSLTTPPCSEGVNWMVMQDPVSVSAAQVAGFTRIFHKSVRPVQGLNGRKIRLGP